MRRATFQTRHGRDHWLFIESGELSDAVREHRETIQQSANRGGPAWCGDTLDGFRRKVVLGDDAMVAQSEKMLASIEDLVPMSRGWRNVDDVVGAIPNIPAFLAGQPNCMRRRQRVASETAPLVVFMDLTSEYSISAYDVMRRGVALLALVRLLTSHRAVELWCGAAQDADQDRASGTTAWRIDTAPLDLSRASYQVAGTAMSRMFAYAINRRLFGAMGGWSFGSNSLQASTGKERAERAFGSEVLFIPRIMHADPMLTNPVEWVRRTLAQYTTNEEE